MVGCHLPYLAAQPDSPRCVCQTDPRHTEQHSVFLNVTTPRRAASDGPSGSGAIPDRYRMADEEEEAVVLQGKRRRVAGAKLSRRDCC